jgi:branched-chain amino acid transport system permease protein
MNQTLRSVLLYAMMALLIAAVGVFQSWTLALAILNLCLISAVMALGVNIQRGYAGLFNVWSRAEPTTEEPLKGDSRQWQQSW